MRFYRQFDLFSPLVLIYFVTLHADQLNVNVGGFTLRFNHLFAMAIAILFIIRFRHCLFSIDKKLAYSLFLTLVSITLSLLFSPYWQRSLIYLGWYGMTLLCYVLLPYFLVKVWDLKRVFNLYCLSFLIVACYGTLQFLFSLFGLHDPFATQYLYGSYIRPNAFCYEPSYYALYLTPFVFLYNAHYLTKDKEPFFIFGPQSHFLAFVINIFYVLTTSTAIFFAYGAFFLLSFFSSPVNRKRLLHFMGVIFASLSLLFFAFPVLTNSLYMKFLFINHSFLERWIGCVNGWKIFLRHPIMGVGLGGYSPYLMDAYLNEEPDFIFTGVEALIADHFNRLKLFEAMNVTTELLASLGLFGLFAFGSLFFLFFFEAKRASIHSKGGFALLISTLVTLLIVQLSQGLLRTYLWTHFALAFAYFEIVNRGQVVVGSRTCDSDLLNAEVAYECRSQ